MVYSRAVPTRSPIVTGGETGIGAAIPDRLSADGYAVTVNGVTLPADGGASIYDPTSAAFADPA